MNEILDEIKKLELLNAKRELTFNNQKLVTYVSCYTDYCYDDLKKFSIVFNNLFSNRKKCSNILTTDILESKAIFKKIEEYLISDNLVNTKLTEEFNIATKTTSIAKYTKDNNFCIMKCYDYFIYIFDKQRKKSYIIVKENKKAITMINILILTPYLMYGELFAVHGGLVSKNNQNILINNSSLGGKTTFAILFATNGWDIITEETTYITKKGIILPYNIRNYFNIRAGTYLEFEEYFLSKDIICNNFIAMKGKSNSELFNLGKNNQVAIDFEKLGKIKTLESKKITHSLKVSISDNQNFIIKKCKSRENVKSFLELSLAPTVLIFQDFLNYNIKNKNVRLKELKNIFKETKSYIVKSGFNYRKNFNELKNTIRVK